MQKKRFVHSEKIQPQLETFTLFWFCPFQDGIFIMEDPGLVLTSCEADIVNVCASFRDLGGIGLRNSCRTSIFPSSHPLTASKDKRP